MSKDMSAIYFECLGRTWFDLWVERVRSAALQQAVQQLNAEVERLKKPESALESPKPEE